MIYTALAQVLASLLPGGFRRPFSGVVVVWLLCGGTLGAQLLTNPDFELADPSTGWEVSGEVDSTEHSLLLYSTDGQGRQFSQLVSVRPDSLTLYQGRFRVRTVDVVERSRAFLWINVLDGDSTMLLETGYGSFSGDTDWQTETFSFLAPASTRSIRLGGSLTGRGKVWFDDFELRAVPLIADSVQLAPAAEAYISAVIDTMQTHAVNRAEIDFDYVRQSIRYAARGAETPADTYDAIRRCLSMLRDRRHSQLYTREQISRMLGGMDLRELLDLERETGSPFVSTPVLDLDSLKEELSFGTARLLEGNVGYVSIPGFTHGHLSALTLYADSLQQLIQQIDQSSNPRGWVIDLRGNWGGANAAMVAGVGPLLRPGSKIYYLEATGAIESSLYYRNGGVYTGEREGNEDALQLQSAVAYTVRDSSSPIAVLIDGGTASAAEVVLAFFKGEESVRLFGEPSTGMITGNEVFPLPDGGALNLAAAYLASKEREIYRGRIVPDRTVIQHSGGDEDQALEAAVGWIVGQ